MERFNLYKGVEMTILNPKIEECVNELLEKDTKEIALDLVAYLRSNNMQFERAGGYWKNQCYWHIKYKEEYVCFILINGF